jgi:hypothetical protein
MPDETYHTDPGMEDADVWSLVCAAMEEGYARTTKRMAVSGGYVYQMEAQQLNPDGSVSLSQSSVFVPDVPRG